KPSLPPRRRRLRARRRGLPYPAGRPARDGGAPAPPAARPAATRRARSAETAGCRAATTPRDRASRAGGARPRVSALRGRLLAGLPGRPPPAELLLQEREQGPRRLRLATLGSQRARSRTPSIEIEMGEAAGAGHEAAQEQRRRDGAGERAVGDVVHV